ncbi:protein ANTI-SILENCING 1 isoform X2 [Nicotiana tabacum]|uniref:Protein ANTI-SILENCING 1 isoform X2 n=1 Tax=Nicotiana tabacum TaxID=4097 RepID=A0AC58TED3_TOBAC
MALAEAVKVEPSADLENDEEVNFVWGRKRGIGGKRKEVQFYESFTYDDVEYALYDCVYMHKEGQLPYIGKIIKIWENPDKSRKIKVHWFFRLSEILYHLKGVKVAAENEIFLASGEGTGLANVNPLEAIAGKCNVVCISEDNRNPQPSEEEVKTADFVFYRAFDVGKCSILDKMDDKVGGLDGMCLSSLVKYVFNRKESQKASHVLKHASDQNGDNNAVEFQATTKESFGLKALNDLGTFKASHLDGKIDVDAQSSLVRQDALQRETNVSRVNKETTKKANSASGEQNSHDVSRVAKAAGKLSHIVGKSDVNVQTSPVRQDPLHGDANDSRVKQQSAMKGNPAPVQIVNSTTTTVVHKQNTISEENARCKTKNEKDDKKVNKPPINLVEAGETGKSPKDLGVLDGRPSNRIKVNDSVILSEDKGVNSVEKSTVCRNEKKVLGTSAVPSEERKKSVDSKDSAGGLDKNMKIRKDSAALDSRPSKKANIDARKVQEDRDKSNMLGKRADNLGKLPKLSTGTSPKEVERTEGKSFEVTRRPVAVSCASSTPWEEVMQTANEQGTLILLENLNPEYTSGEVEDIIWHACRENCTTKMVQRTAFSSPYSGRALVAFKTRGVAERVTKKLADGCLMVSNQRPLVASFVSLPKTEGNASSLAGHLCVDKLRLQLQREMREAVSTSHCSQPNTIEYEMANEWRLLQARSDSWWNRLYKQQKEDLTKIASGL